MILPPLAIEITLPKFFIMLGESDYPWDVIYNNGNTLYSLDGFKELEDAKNYITHQMNLLENSEPTLF